MSLIAMWQSGVLDPRGPVAHAQRAILLNATVIMLAVIIPVIIGTVAFAWWFRSGNKRALRRPDWAYSGALEVVVWSIPLLVIMFLGGIGWLSSHELDPGKPIEGTGETFTVQVVSLDWKWLFIYPNLGIASVNRLVVPAGRPFHLELTSATVMNSFFVPQLGSQIYTMPGMTTNLHLKADRPGKFDGISAQFSGHDFSDMRFEVDALPADQFDTWVAGAHAKHQTLDAKSYAQLAQPSGAVPPTTYNVTDPALFENIVANNGASADKPDAANLPASAASR